MTLRLRTRLSLSFLFLSLVSVALISVFVNFFLETLFRDYAIRKQEQRNVGLAELVAKQYSAGGQWNAQVIQNIGISVLEESLILKLTDPNGDVIWDAVQYNSGICHAMIDTMASRMTAKYPSLGGGLTHREYPVTVDGTEVGTLSIGYYGPFFYSDSEFFFIDTLNNILLVTALIAIVASLVTGIVFAAALSAPLAALSHHVGLVAQGELSPIRNVRSRMKEVHDLVASINSMIETLSSQEILRKRLTADVAHELRTPLSVLQAELEALIDGVEKVSTDRLASLHEEIIRLTRLVDRLEVLARLDASVVTLERQEFDLGDFIRAIADRFRSTVAEKALELRVNCTKIKTCADREKITQVIHNLLSNAIEYTNRGGSIAVDCADDAAGIRLKVSDTGCGIPPADLPFVFERFYRVDKSRTRSTGGAGIGLAIVHEIVRAHGGTVKIESEAGRGTVVKIKLPRSSVAD